MKLRFALSCAAVAALVSLQLPATAQMPTTSSYLGRLKQSEDALAALPAAAYTRQRDPASDEQVRKFYPQIQMLGTMRAFAGDQDGAIAAFDIHRRRFMFPSRDVQAQMKLADDAVAEDAIAAIVREARTKRVVLLNEAHHVPLHRAFAQKLAAELRKIGYTYLACETFNERGVAAASAKGYTAQNTGFYTQDAVFAGFVNSALADKWQLVPYEFEGPPVGATFEERQTQREYGQAKNLVDRIFAKDKDARVFIYVGYGHLNKKPEGSSETLLMMGEHLRRLAKLDMLHVSQTDFFAHPDPADEDPVYAPLLAKFPSNRAFVLRSPDGSHPILLGLGGRIDMQVVHPRYAVQAGRPEWLATLAGREPRAIPANLLPEQGRRLVKAYRAGDPGDAVPADIVLVEAGRPVPALMLPKGDFRFEFEE
jgi:hypothetical protein